MKLTLQQLKDLGYVETIPGHWHKGKEVLVNQYPEDRSVITVNPPKRIRQSTKPLMNKLEQSCFDWLGMVDPDKTLFAQAVTFRLANGVRYTPDIFCFDWLWSGVIGPAAWEVKGPWMTDDAVVKLKVFAAAYPNIRVFLESHDKATGRWICEPVLP